MESFDGAHVEPVEALGVGEDIDLLLQSKKSSDAVISVARWRVYVADGSELDGEERQPGETDDQSDPLEESCDVRKRTICDLPEAKTGVD
jgi:hypothetical protein